MQSQVSADPIAHVRLAGPLLERVENWRRCQARIPSRCRAVEYLIELALDQAAEAAG